MTNSAKRWGGHMTPRQAYLFPVVEGQLTNATEIFHKLNRFHEVIPDREIANQLSTLLDALHTTTECLKELETESYRELDRKEKAK